MAAMYAISSHTTVCSVAKKAGASHFEYIDRKKKKWHFHTCIVPWPLFQSTPFLHYSCLPGGVDHTANWIKFTTAICDMGVQSFSVFFVQFFPSYAVQGLWGLRFLFAHFVKIVIKHI